MRRCLIIIITFLFPLLLHAKQNTRLHDLYVTDDNNIIVELIGASVEYDYFELANPARLVIDLKNSISSFKFKKSDQYIYIKNISQTIIDNDLRVVIDFYVDIDVEQVVIKKTNNNKFALGFQIKESKKIAKGVEIETIDEIINVLLKEESDREVEITKKTQVIKKKHTLGKTKNLNKIIIIDAGHGGKDPGAIGYSKAMEKDITLEFAKYLSNYLKKKTDYKIFLTRNNDKYLKLSDRNHIARERNADLFISLHADAATNLKARGFSIYTLSDKASDIQAAKLAKKENYSDVIAGVDLTGYNKDVKSFLIDLSQDHGKAESKIFAKILVNNLKHKIKIKTNAIRYAGFAVLKNTNMASVLIELGFVTNKQDYKMLKSTAYKKNLTTSIKKSIDEYFAKSR